MTNKDSLVCHVALRTGIRAFAFSTWERWREVWWVRCELLGLVLLASIGSLPACAQGLPDVQRVGVFAETPEGLIELPFGRESAAESFSGFSVRFQFDDAVPRVRSVNALYVNVPDAVVSESKLYSLRTIGAVWTTSAPGVPLRGPDDIGSVIEVPRPGLYRFVPNEAPTARSGYLAISLRMPQGVPDRLYAVRLSNDPYLGEPIPLVTRGGGFFFGNNFLRGQRDIEIRSPEYVIRFSSSRGSFDTAILKAPAEAAVVVLQQQLVGLTGLTPEDLCSLQIEIGVPRAVQSGPRSMRLPGCGS